MKTTRRTFLNSAAAATGALCLAPLAFAAEAPQSTRRYRAAIIGRTGGGDYGHGYDQIFKGLENVDVEAIADRDPAGLQKAAARCGARRQYTDYREMLEKEKPDLVSIAPRHPDCHPELALAAIAVCRGIFIEKPFTETAAAADQILAAAEKRGVNTNCTFLPEPTDRANLPQIQLITSACAKSLFPDPNCGSEWS